ncbi:hypothetical protein FKP32DRAFT_1551844, partial [Trametes sanguinea]
MLTAARKYNVRLDVSKPSSVLKEALPIWSHVGLPMRGNHFNAPAAVCLRTRHGVQSVGTCVAVARRIDVLGMAHTPRADCDCTSCHSDREELGCANPHKCAVAASQFLARLAPKWAPATNDAEDNLSLTKSRKRKNAEARTTHDVLLFDPSLTTDAPLSEAVRVF